MAVSTVAAANAGPVEQTNVKVMVRVRPFNSRELNMTDANGEPVRTVVLMEGTTVRLLDHEKNYAEREAFEFDQAFWSIPESQGQYSPNPFSTNEDVFNVTGKPAVLNALQGYHNTIFAYGQTGSGKTHTMLGNLADEGIAPRVVRSLFEEIERNKRELAYERIQYSVELSFIEIYNEKVKDLLMIAEKGKGRSNQGESGYADCRVRYHPEKGTFVEGLTRIAITSEEQCLTSIKDGMEHRATTSTLMNDTSSRSHAIFQICLSQKMPLKGTSRVSIINLVDLAGSERISMSGVQGSALKEAMSINLSLSTLRRVIDILIENSKLKKGQRPSVPPFRESLLTWVLSDSLGGNSKTVMVAAISPFYGNMEDTLGTLRYALKAKAIVCNARVNEERTQAVVNSLRLEMEELRRSLLAKASADQQEQDRIKQELKEAEENYERMQQESRDLEMMKEQYEEDLRKKTEQLSHVQTEIEELAHAEEEKERREAELNQARANRAEAEELLRRREEERQNRERELEALKERKKMLQEHHDKAAEEEARAKLAAEQSRLRQFASAFQNAFILGKQKSGLIELEEEFRQLQLSVEDLEKDKVEKEKKLLQLINDRGMFKRKMDLSKKRAEEIYEEIQQVIKARESHVTQSRMAREAAEKALKEAQRELEEKETKLKTMQQVNKVEQASADKNMKMLELQLQSVREEYEKQVNRREALTRETRRAEEEVNYLDKQLAIGSSKLQELQMTNSQKEAKTKELKERKAELAARRLEVAERNSKCCEEYDDMVAQLETLVAEINSLRASHNELRSFVNNKFFPVSNPAPVAMPTRRTLNRLRK